jgi:low temperature requirement protein LtrA
LGADAGRLTSKVWLERRKGYLFTNYPHETKKVLHEVQQAKIAEQKTLAKFRAFYDWIPLIVAIVVFSVWLMAKVLVM